MYGPAEVEALAEVLADHPQVAIISDEIYEKIVYGSIEHRSIGSVESVRDRVVTINGMSKAFAMTGWRIGYLAAPGQGGVIANGVATLQSQTTSCITSFCYDAIVAALEGGRDDTERMRRAFGARARLIHELVSAWPGVRCPRPTGAFYIFPDVGAYLGRTSPGGASLATSFDFAKALLEEAGVAVIPGQEFGRCGAAHVRLSFATSEELIRTGCGRIAEWLKGVRG
jgi:aspartate aminotransferase